MKYALYIFTWGCGGAFLGTIAGVGTALQYVYPHPSLAVVPTQAAIANGVGIALCWLSAGALLGSIAGIVHAANTEW